jgi:hypothetical protein
MQSLLPEALAHARRRAGDHRRDSGRELGKEAQREESDRHDL